MSRRLILIFFLISGIATSQTQTSLSFWLDAVKKPLSGPKAEELFVANYKDALLPPPRSFPYLEGRVVSVEGSNVLLSMESNGIAGATLVFRETTLQSEPPKGTLVRFSGVMRKFTKEPLMIFFEPEKVIGLE